MATISLPTPADLGAFFYRLSLNGGAFTLDFQLNEREDAWYFDVIDDAGNAVREGVKIVTGWDLLLRVAQGNRPTGRFIAIDTQLLNRDADAQSFGDTVKLLYEEATG